MIKSNVKAQMEKAGLSVRKTMSITGLASGTLLRARSDETIGCCTLDTLSAIATACSCRIKALFTEPGEPIGEQEEGSEQSEEAGKNT